MSATYDQVDRDNEQFLRIFRRVLATFAVLIGIFLAATTYGTLKSNPGYMQDWRGAACILLTISVFLLYITPILLTMRLDWPLPTRLAIGLWGGMYLAVILLWLIDRAFLWDLYIVFAVTSATFAGRRAILAVVIVTLTLFVLEGALAWPLNGDALPAIVGQFLTLFSMTSFIIMFQNLMEERFERGHLVKCLAQSNRELEEAHRQLAQSAEKEQELAVLQERTRLAREMHDTIGHALVLISVKLEAAQRLRTRDPERSDQELEATKQIARETMSALRASIADLRSPSLEYEHINQALSRSARELAQRGNLSVSYTLQTDLDVLPEAVEEALWKVSQEAFTNIERHAQANRVEVRISRRGELLLLCIHDDGVGLPAELSRADGDGEVVYSSPEGHYGLRGMRERVEAIGGRLMLHSGEGQGTMIEVEVPLVDN